MKYDDTLLLEWLDFVQGSWRAPSPREKMGEFAPRNGKWIKAKTVRVALQKDLTEARRRDWGCMLAFNQKYHRRLTRLPK